MKGWPYYHTKRRKEQKESASWSSADLEARMGINLTLAIDIRSRPPDRHYHWKEMPKIRAPLEKIARSPAIAVSVSKAMLLSGTMS